MGHYRNRHLQVATLFHAHGAALRGDERARFARQTRRQPGGDVPQSLPRAARFSRRPPRPDSRLTLRLLHFPEIRQAVGSATETVWSPRIALKPPPRPAATEEEVPPNRYASCWSTRFSVAAAPTLKPSS